MLRERVRNAAIWAFVVGSSAVAVPDALAVKMSAAIGLAIPGMKVSSLIDAALKPAGGAGGSDLKLAANAAWATALACMLLFSVFAILRLQAGARGAGERLAAVFGGAVLLIATTAVLA